MIPEFIGLAPTGDTGRAKLTYREQAQVSEFTFRSTLNVMRVHGGEFKKLGSRAKIENKMT